MAATKPAVTGPTEITPLPPKSLPTKLAEIMASIPDVRPEGKNTFFNYQYITDKQVNGLIRPKLAAAGICVIPDVEEHEIVERETKQGKSLLTRLVVRFTLIDGETGQTISGRGEGYGDDSGDKGANKAFTAAMKFWLMKTFMIGGEDPEADESTDKRYAGGDGGSSRTVSVTASSSKREVAKGGKNVSATDVQVNEIARLSTEAGLDHYGVAAIVRATVGKEVTLPDNEAERRTVLRAFLSGLTGEEAGKVIQMLMESHVVSDEVEGVPVDASPVDA